MNHIYIILITLAITITSCSENQKSENQKSTSKTSVESQKTSSTFDYKYFVVIADIDSKESPTTEGKVQETIKKNTIVKSLNEVSQFSDTLMVDRRQYIEPYQKVKVIASGTETWIFGGVLKSIYSGDKDITNPKDLLSFYNTVSSLDPSDLSSGKKIIDKLKEVKSEDSSANDAMFFMTYDYINKLARSSKAHGALIANHSWTLDDYNGVITGTMDVEYHPIGKLMHENGLMLEGALGEILVKSDIRVIADILDGKVSQSVQEYIALLKLSIKSKVFDNDNIIAPLTSLANQANLWSQLAHDYPDFAHISNIKMKSDRFTQALLGGTKNTAAFDHSSRTAKKEYREIWKYVLQHYSDTPLATEVRSHTKWLEGRDWKFPDEKHVH